MLSNLVVNNQCRNILIVDEIGQTRVAKKFIRELLRQQAQDESTIKEFPYSGELENMDTFKSFVETCQEGPPNSWNVILPTYSDFLASYEDANLIVSAMHYLSRMNEVRRVFLWVSTHQLEVKKAAYVLGSLEYVSDLVLRLESPNRLSVLIRQPGGGVSLKAYNYDIKDNQVTVQIIDEKSQKNAAAAKADPEIEATFKIDLNEEEQVARNSLKLPYEKTAEGTGDIIYSSEEEGEDDEEI